VTLNRRRFVIGTVAAAAAGAALVADGCSAFRSLTPSIASAGYKLNVEYATSNIAGYTMRTRTYNGSTAGPTLEAYPGTTLTITVNNELPPNPAATVPPQGEIRVPVYRTMDDLMRRKPTGTSIATAAVDPMNNPNNFNTTNLHVHGIQTVPHLYDPIGTSNPAAEMIAIEPGQQFTYNLPVPIDQPSGLYWYHPHHHGATDVQVSGGMAGLIVVRGPIDQVPEIAAAREIFMVIQSINVNPGAGGVYDYEPVAYQPQSNPAAYSGGTNFTMMTVNGQGVLWIDNTSSNNMNVAGTPLALPQFAMQPGEVVRVRLLNGTNGWYLPLLLPGMTCNLIGFDGVNLVTPVEATFDFAGTVTQFNLSEAGTNVLSTAPGNRIEMLVQAPTTPGLYTLSVAPQTGVEFSSAGFNLAQFVVGGAPVTMSIPTALPQPTRDAPIADSEITTRRTITFHETVNQPVGFATLLTGFYPYIDNALFDEGTINYNLTLGAAEEWTIVNQTSCGHPFHIHVNSYQLTAVNGVPLAVPEVWDTFMVPPAQAMQTGNQFDGYTPQGSITIRIRFQEWSGKSVFHCHILGHEDTGMMNNILIS
jgi:suppressor of ftsI